VRSLNRTKLTGSQYLPNNHDDDLLFPGTSSSNDEFVFSSGSGQAVFGQGDGGNDAGEGEPNVNLNRKLINKGGITAQSQENGKVAIDIWVDDKGGVVKVKFNPTKSNTSSQHLIGLAKKWAKTIKYDESLGSPIQFVGYQVFSFTKHE
jgi:hypothetical protein